MPRVGEPEPENFWMNGLYESVVILLVFPLVVAIGAGSKVVGRKSRKVCKFLGDISYPLYITHYPLIYVQMGWLWATRTPLSPNTSWWPSASSA